MAYKGEVSFHDLPLPLNHFDFLPFFENCLLKIMDGDTSLAAFR